MDLGLNFKASTLAITLVGLLALAILKWFMPELRAATSAGTPVDPNAADRWGTPFYLRYNTPIPAYLANLMPVSSNYAYNLGVPSAPYTQQAAIT